MLLKLLVTADVLKKPKAKVDRLEAGRRGGFYHAFLWNHHTVHTGKVLMQSVCAGRFFFFFWPKLLG